MRGYLVNSLYSGGISIHIDAISMVVYTFLNYDIFLSLKVVLNLANDAGPEEKQLNTAFLMGLHCFYQSTHLGVSIIQRIKEHNNNCSL